MPWRLSSLALAWTASVAEGASVARRLASIRVGSSTGGVGLLLGKFRGQPLLDAWRHHAGDRRAVAGDFLDETRRNIGVALVRHQEDCLDGPAQLAVHERHLELVLEIGDGADPAHDAVGALARDEVDGE